MGNTTISAWDTPPPADLFEDFNFDEILKCDNSYFTGDDTDYGDYRDELLQLPDFTSDSLVLISPAPTMPTFMGCSRSLSASSSPCFSSPVVNIQNQQISSVNYTEIVQQLKQKNQELQRKLDELEKKSITLNSSSEQCVESENNAESSMRAVAELRSNRKAPVERRKELKNSRPVNIAAFERDKHYDPLPIPPRSWASSSNIIFHYTADGELDPTAQFSPKQIQSYLDDHPHHTMFGTGPKGSGLILWIQNIPADAGKRYPTLLSSKCRFIDCPIPKNTISKGEFRVAFDENTWWQPNHDRIDPYHCAGYVHLYCLEYFLNFPAICKTHKVKGDCRSFLEGKNKMAITRDYPSMLAIVDDFIENSQPWMGVRPDNWYDFSLCRKLTIEHLSKQPKQRQGVREARDGNSIDRHLNNLRVKVLNVKLIQAKKRGLNIRIQRTSAVPKQNTSGKRKERSYHDKMQTNKQQKVEQEDDVDFDNSWLAR